MAFAFYNNWNANEVVKEKVSETYRNTLHLFVEQMDDTLLEINSYLYKMESQDADIGVMQSYPYLSDPYMLTKLRLSQKLNRDIGFYNMIDTILLYTQEDMVLATKSNEMSRKTIVQNHIQHLIELEATQQWDAWHLIYDEQVEGQYLLARIHQLNTGFYGLVLVKLADIERLLDIQWNNGKIGHTVIYDHTGTKLTQGHSPSIHQQSVQQLILSSEKGTYTIMDDQDGIQYMVMSQASDVADISYNIMVSESTMLSNIPFLQKATYFLPLVIMLMVSIFLLFMNGVIFRPLGELMRGMKKISLGDLDIRLPENKTMEFQFLASSFNNMAQEVKNLKIDIYEEQLRVREAEFKHLQAQISPHFYMNSLNIIYNFAVLGDQESVKKMSLHLADYFRFIMRTNRSTVTIDEELRHIENYIEIQKFRFPDKLEFEVEVEDDLRSFELPALAIQPFVENAMIHGFKNRKQTFKVYIEIRKEENYIVIQILDTGIGFSSEVLQCLNEKQPLTQTSQSSRLGIGNVIHRLQLHFHQEVNVNFSNNTHGGALVCIEIPTQTWQITDERSRGEDDVQFVSRG